MNHIAADVLSWLIVGGFAAYLGISVLYAASWPRFRKLARSDGFMFLNPWRMFTSPLEDIPHTYAFAYRDRFEDGTFGGWQVLSRGYDEQPFRLPHSPDRLLVTLITRLAEAAEDDQGAPLPPEALERLRAYDCLVDLTQRIVSSEAKERQFRITSCYPSELSNQNRVLYESPYVRLSDAKP